MATISSNPWDQYHASVRGRAGGATQIGDCLEIILDSEKNGPSTLITQVSGISSSTPPSIRLYAYQRQVKAANGRVWALYTTPHKDPLKSGKKSFKITFPITYLDNSTRSRKCLDTVTLKEINFLGSEKDRIAARSALSNCVPVVDLVSLITDYYPILKEEANWVLNPKLHPCHPINHYPLRPLIESTQLSSSFEWCEPLPQDSCEPPLEWSVEWPGSVPPESKRTPEQAQSKPEADDLSVSSSRPTSATITDLLLQARLSASSLRVGGRLGVANPELDAPELDAPALDQTPPHSSWCKRAIDGFFNFFGK